jgi:hypothetical protein
VSTDEVAEYRQKMEKQLERMRTFMRNRRKILRSMPPEEREGYLNACKEAWEAGKECPPFPTGRVSSVEVL